jgi:hypothetical protein
MYPTFNIDKESSTSRIRLESWEAMESLSFPLDGFVSLSKQGLYGNVNQNSDP